MLFPAVPVLTAQDHQLPLLSSQGSEMRDLHDHRPDTARQNTQWGQELTTSKTSTSTVCRKVTWNSSPSGDRDRAGPSSGALQLADSPTVASTPPRGHQSSGPCCFLKPMMSPCECMWHSGTSPLINVRITHLTKRNVHIYEVCQSLKMFSTRCKMTKWFKRENGSYTA